MTNIDSQIIKSKIQQNKETINDRKELLFKNIFLLNSTPNDFDTSSDVSLKNYEIINEIKIEDKMFQTKDKNFENLIYNNENQTNILINKENNFKNEVNMQQPILKYFFT